MKEIWKAFAEKCKEAWKQTSAALAKVFNEFVEDSKELLVKGIDLVKNIIGNSVKALETITMNLVVAVLTALFAALYDSIIYLLDELKKLFTKAE